MSLRGQQLREQQDLEYEASVRADRIRGDNARVLELWPHQSEWRSADQLRRMNELSPRARRALVASRRLGYEQEETKEEEKKTFISCDGVELDPAAVRCAYECAERKDAVGVDAELFTDADGSKATFRYWLTDAGDLERAEALVPVDPLSVLGRVCTRVSGDLGYDSADHLFCEMMENGAAVAQICALLDYGVSADTIVDDMVLELTPT